MMAAQFDVAEAAARYEFAGQDLPWLLRHWAAHQPDRPLMIWEPHSGAARTWSYGEFERDVRRLAAGLDARGIRKGDKVLIHSDNCPEMVLAWYACAWVGACAVTTNTRSVGGEIEYFAEHAQVVAAITQPQYAAQVAANAKRIRWLAVTADNSGEAADTEQLRHDGLAFDSLYGDAEAAPERPAEPMLPAGIMFTSGTTSRPKAVVHTHANALWAARIGPDNLNLQPGDVYLAFLPFFHVNAQSWAFWSALGAGTAVVLQPRFSASRFWDVVQRHRVTHVSLIPFVFKAIGAQPVPEHSLKVLVLGIVWKEIENWLNARILACWGMTETVIHATRSDFFKSWPQGSIGKPTPGYQFAIVDPDTGALCDEGEIGELWLRGTRGVQLFLEYYDNPEANAKSFTEDGWFKTGDLVKLGPEGDFFYCDRDKDALKVGGENVSARQVEEVCMQVGGIGEIAVVSRSHPMLDMVPVAFVIKGYDAPQDDAGFAARIIDHCKANLADFKVPRAVYFVDEFPRATLDKVAKNKLREMAEEMPPLT